MRWVAGLALLAASCAALCRPGHALRCRQTPAGSASDAGADDEGAGEGTVSLGGRDSGFASNDTKLPIEHSVKRKLISRDEVNSYLREKFDEDEGAKRMERSEIVLKKFGLLDRDFHLRPFLLTLLTEQIAGFYDNKTKTVNLLDWIKPEEQKPVLAHELTHALQDQKVGLTKWSRVSLNGTSQNVQEDNRHLRWMRRTRRASAVAEGQAMAVFVDYTLRPTGKTLADAPDMADTAEGHGGGYERIAGDGAGSAAAAGVAAVSLQRGLGFEQAILVKGGQGGGVCRRAGESAVVELRDHASGGVHGACCRCRCCGCRIFIR